MTITGASLYNSLLKELKPEIVIVEEAAEVLEPQLLAALGSWTKYMILVGDHQQLRPKVETYHLQKNYHFDVSMMERLINNNLPYTTLKLQNRQRDEFADLLLDIYSDLQTNHERIRNNLPASCLEKSMFFWDIKGIEIKSRSVYNKEEADAAVRLGLFLVQQGYSAEKITILGTYNGQTSLMKKVLQDKSKSLLRLGSNASNIKITTVDMYQGDENDFVIVSLVRSNAEGNIGFLKELNRRCVAQSRAKCGLYFIGNLDSFYSSPTWRPMIEKMEAAGCVGQLIIVCKDHPETSVQLNGSDSLTLGTFCSRQCNKMFSCGLRRCKSYCQPPHQHNPCPEKDKFTRLLCRHEDEKSCEQKFDKICHKLVNFEFEKCGHPGMKKCHEDINTMKCNKVMNFEFEKCKHQGKKKCHEDVNVMKCYKEVNFEFERCKHQGKKKCHEDVNVMKCYKEVNFKFERCKHQGKKKCHEDVNTMKCNKVMNFEFDECGHPGKRKCHEYSNSIICYEVVRFDFERCKHQGKKKCHEDVNTMKCNKVVNFDFEECGHPGNKKCHEDSNNVKCYKEVAFKCKECKHQGKKKCHEDVDDRKCNEIVDVKLKCGHSKKKRCYQENDALQCLERCFQKKPCGHMCNYDHKCNDHQKNINSCVDCQIVLKEKKKELKRFETQLRKDADEKLQEEIKRIKEETKTNSGVSYEEIKKEKETLSQYLAIEDLVKKYIQPGHKWYPTVTKIEKVRNLTLLHRFMESSRHLFDKDPKVVQKFHGTSNEGITGITQNGFRLPSRSGMYGAGIYLATDSSKSAQSFYTKGSNKLLMCDVYLGKVYTTEKATPKMNAEQLRELGCDSLFAPRDSKQQGGVLYDEFAIFNPDQVYPRYIVSYEKTNFDPKEQEMTFHSDYQLGKKTIKPSRQVDVSDPLEKHFSFVEARFLRMMKNNSSSQEYQIQHIEFYINPTLHAKFKKKEMEFQKTYPGKDEAKPIYGFHGTKSEQAVESIMNQNFNPSTRGKFGAGVYFSEQPAYTFGYGGEKHLIMARILPGRTFHCKSSGYGNRKCTPGYDSHGGFKRTEGTYETYDEIVIFEPDQILPCYVIYIK